MSRFQILIVMTMLGVCQAKADLCASVVAGAQMGPSPNFRSWPYSNACYVSWPGGSGSVRASYEQQCRQIAGYIHFEGDYGSNRNTCIFSAPQTRSNRPTEDPVNIIFKGVDEHFRKEVNRYLAQIKAIHDELNKGGSIYKIYGLYKQSAEAWHNLRINDRSNKVENSQFFSDRAQCMRDIIFTHIKYNFEYRFPRFYRSECDKLLKDEQLYKEIEQLIDQPRDDMMAAPGRWFGAIAVNRTSFKYYSYSINKPDAFTAAQEALESCEKFTLNTRPEMDQLSDCKISMSLRNECGAFTLSEDGQNGVTSTSKKDLSSAKATSMRLCSEKYGINCRNVLTICSKGPND